MVSRENSRALPTRPIPTPMEAKTRNLVRVITIFSSVKLIYPTTVLSKSQELTLKKTELVLE